MQKDPETKKKKKTALGRGLSSLLPDIEEYGEEDSSQTHYFYCDIDAIHPNPFQPRTRFSEDELEELTASIREQGVIQPLLVRRAESGYELVAGERRLRASRMAGFLQVPVVVKDLSDAKLLEISIVENIQRQNLNPMEESHAYHRLMKEFNLTQDEVAMRVGKSRPSVANFLRLLQLPSPVQASIEEGTISMGHAKALMGAENEALLENAWRKVMTKGLSVRETEKLVQKLKNEKETPPRPRSAENVYYDSLSEDISRRLGTKVRIRKQGKKGKVEIEFYSDDDLDRLIEILSGT